MVFTDMPVEGAETVANGVHWQVRPDLSTSDPQATATDPT